MSVSQVHLPIQCSQDPRVGGVGILQTLLIVHCPCSSPQCSFWVWEISKPAMQMCQSRISLLADVIAADFFSGSWEDLTFVRLIKGVLTIQAVIWTPPKKWLCLLYPEKERRLQAITSHGYRCRLVIWTFGKLFFFNFLCHRLVRGGVGIGDGGSEGRADVQDPGEWV